MKNLRTVDKENINIHITYDEAIKLKLADGYYK